MCLNREEYETIRELFCRMSFDYREEQYEFTESTNQSTVSLRIIEDGHELLISYVYGNNRIFLVDEWDSMKTMSPSNIATLPHRIKTSIEEWHEMVKSSTEPSD